MSFITTSNLVRRTSPWGEIHFIHFRDGSKRDYYSCINDMTGNRMSAFGADAPSIDDPMPYVKSVFKGIHTKATSVTSCVGNICPVCNSSKKRKTKTLATQSLAHE